MNFPTLNINKPTSNLHFINVIRNVSTKFSKRFSDLRFFETKFRFFITPFDVDVKTVPE